MMMTLMLKTSNKNANPQKNYSLCFAPNVQCMNSFRTLFFSTSLMWLQFQKYYDALKMLTRRNKRIRIDIRFVLVTANTWKTLDSTFEYKKKTFIGNCIFFAFEFK